MKGGKRSDPPIEWRIKRFAQHLVNCKPDRDFIGERGLELKLEVLATDVAYEERANLGECKAKGQTTKPKEKERTNERTKESKGTAGEPTMTFSKSR